MVPSDRSLNSFTHRERTCLAIRKAFPALGGASRTTAARKMSLGTQMLVGGSGWAELGAVGEEAGGLAEGMQISIMNYASAQASHTFGAE